MPEFIPGLRLSRLFFFEQIKPILDENFPDLRYSAALLGAGSEVLGFDTEMSTDHGWGPRADLFLEEEDATKARALITEALRSKLPHSFRGFSTSFASNEHGTWLPVEKKSGPVEHRVEVLTLSEFFFAYLGLDISRPLAPADWLTLPQQKLGTIASGAVFHDQIGLQTVRDRLTFYPEDVWLYLLASGWERIGQEEHLMGRAGLVGDEIGSALIGARLVRDVMRLCFLMERKYAPYPKWFGTAFQRLACAGEVSPPLRAALAATTWQKREEHLSKAYEVIAAMHNALGLTEPLPDRVQRFFGRPFQVIALHGFAEALRARISDEAVRRIAAKRPIGSVDQFSDSTDLLSGAEWRATLRRLYE